MKIILEMDVCGCYRINVCFDVVFNIFYNEDRFWEMFKVFFWLDIR